MRIGAILRVKVAIVALVVNVGHGVRSRSPERRFLGERNVRRSCQLLNSIRTVSGKAVVNVGVNVGLVENGASTRCRVQTAAISNGVG